MHRITKSIMLISLLAIFSNACSNGKTISAGSGARVTASNSATLPTSSSEGAFSVSKVMKSNQNADTTLDLLGVNGEFGTYCATAADCVCRFNWTDSSGSFHEIDQPLGYVETNLARCLYTSVDSNISYFDVKLVVTAGNVSSNTTRVFVGAVNPSFDSTNKNNFVQISRYMCIDHVGATSTSQTNLYEGLVDPRLWSMSYAFNLYTYSMGRDYGAVSRSGSQSSNVKRFECPVIPNDSNFADYTGTTGMIDLTLSSIDKINLSNPLLVNQATGDNTIYPATDNTANGAACVNGTEPNCEQYKINRHDFYLASFQDGVFKEPVCTRHTVENLTQTYTNSNTYKCSVDSSNGPAVLGGAALVANGSDIIGFAAYPDANQNCPSSTTVAIPSGYKWAKLWLMQAELPVRTVPYVTNANDIGQLYCTSRETECFTNSGLVGSANIVSVPEQSKTNSVCWSTTNPTGLSVGPQQSYPGYGNCSSTGTMGDNQAPGTAYRAGNCKGYTYLNPGNIGPFEVNCCMDAGFISSASLNNMTTQQQIDIMRPANYTPGGDYCNPSLVGGNDGAGAGGKDNWLIGNGNRRACIESDTNNNGALYSSAIFSSTTGDPLSTYQMGTSFVDQNPLPDYVFVVTPPRVTVENMQNPSDPVGLQFTPKRTMPNSANPIVYRFNAQTTAPPTNGNIPSSMLAKYPLCVLQKTGP